MRSYIWIIFLLILCGTVLTQDELRVVKPVAPAIYPPAARAVRAWGEVGVSVEIDPKGKVISAKAFSGHPLLRAISESTSLKWEFTEVVKDSPVRSMLLFFRYREGGIKYVEESEKSEDTVFSSMFPTMFSVELSYDTVFPRLLLLSREKGVIAPKACPLHNETMLIEIQNATCFREESGDLFERSEDYNAAEDEEFPNANPEETRGCRENGIERVEVYFCQACRIARSSWIQINR